MRLFTYKSLSVRCLMESDAWLFVKWLSDPAVLQYYEGRDRPHNDQLVQKHFYEERDFNNCLLLKLPMIKNIPLDTLIDQYDQIQTWLRDVCLKLSDDDLDKIVPYENGDNATIRWGIWHVADHSRHHYANIAYLKKWLKGNTSKAK